MGTLDGEPLKKGVAWAGCSGRTGARPAVENCQIGVFLGSPMGSPDRRHLARARVPGPAPVPARPGAEGAEG